MSISHTGILESENGIIANAHMPCIGLKGR
jgi:hypothetical protein